VHFYIKSREGLEVEIHERKGIKQCIFKSTFVMEFKDV